MKIISKSGNIVKFRITNRDDLWYLFHIVEKGDLLKALTERKIKIAEKQVKKTYFLEIKVEKLDYTENSLKILGTVTQGLEEVPQGSYQSITLEQNSEATLIKETWKKIHQKKIGRASCR